MTKLILIRGNSGSGKTSVAQSLHHQLGPGNLLISQDMIRREMLNVKDTQANLAIGLIEQLVLYGVDHCEYIVMEGIFPKNKYEEMLVRIMKQAKIVYCYYYDLSFDETVRRNETKKNGPFSLSDLKNWFLEKDYLSGMKERRIDETVTEEEMVKLVLADLNKKN